MSLVKTQSEFLLDVANLIVFATSKGFTVTGGELFRTVEQQQIYLNRGLTKTMDSQHLKRLAVDLNFFFDGVAASREKMAEIACHWLKLNKQNRWGGNFKNFYDGNHFERVE